MKQTLQLVIKPTTELTTNEYSEMIDLCSRAFEEDYEIYMQSFQNSIHVLGRLDDQLVTHAMWVPRLLQLADGTPLQTAYVEGVATEEAYRNRGYAAAIMQRVADEIQGFDIAGLAPFSVAYYSRLGWERWQGSLLIRKDGKLLPTPPDEDGDEECLMIIEWREGEVW